MSVAETILSVSILEAGELVMHQGLQGGIRLLEKPFTRSPLLKIIDEALG
jgi:hypothetical protein